MHRYHEAAGLLQSVEAVRHDPELDAIRQRLRGDALMHCGRCEDAKSEYWTSLNNDASPFAIEDVGDRIARCDWLEMRDVRGTHR
jgi:predicted negative regulator of RcsB-dependent stress response